MTKKHWLNIIDDINKGKKIKYIRLNNGDVLYSQHFYKKRIFNDIKFIGKYETKLSTYWCSVTHDSIRMNFSRESGYYDYIYKGILFTDIKYIKFYD